MKENVLLYAIFGKNTNLVGKLISLNLTNMKQRMRHYETYLQIAIDGPELTPIQKMLINHPDIDINASDASSETALIKAAKCNNIGLVDLIVSHPNYDSKLSLCNEAFYYATSFKELSRKFLQMKSIDVNSHIDQESTPLMGAIKSDDEELVKMIMDHPTFDPIQSKILSCLFQPVSCKNLILFKIFLENEWCCPFQFHLNNPNHKCKCKSKHISEDDENIYEDLFADKENERNYFDPNDEEEVVNKKNEVDENHDFDDLRCTLDLSGFNPTLQPLYHCRKCKVDICQNCAIRCHQGHPLNYKGMSPNSICYCMNVTDCKCTERKETVCTYLFYGKEKN